MIKKLLIVMLLLGFAFCFSAYAEENAGSKLGRGLSNIATGWVEVPKQIYLTSRDKDPFYGLFYGGAKGITDGLLRTVTGIYDTTFFLLPPYDEAYLEPEFVFEGWDEFAE